MPRRRGLLAGASGLALVAAILGAATAAALGSGDGLLSAALALAFGSPILLIAHVFARQRERDRGRALPAAGVDCIAGPPFPVCPRPRPDLVPPANR